MYFILTSVHGGSNTWTSYITTSTHGRRNPVAIACLTPPGPVRAHKRDRRPQIYWNEKKNSATALRVRLHRTRYIFPRLCVRARRSVWRVRASRISIFCERREKLNGEPMGALPVLRTRCYLARSSSTLKLRRRSARLACVTFTRWT